MDFVSFVVPTFNVEKYLYRSIISILCQSHRELEIIIVDDGSCDNSSQICDEMCVKDLRVYSIHNYNGGPSLARNFGIEFAISNVNSRWISFVDSDDWIENRYIELLLKAIKETKQKMSVCNVKKVCNEDDLTMVETSNVIYKTIDVDDIYKEIDDVAIFVNGKLWDIQQFKNIRFPLGKICEDRFTTYKIIFKYNKIAYVDAPLYNYFTRNNSIMRSAWNPNRLDDIYACQEQIEFFENNRFENAKISIINRYLMLLSDFFFLSKKYPRERKKIKKLLVKELEKYKSLINDNEYEYIYNSIHPLRRILRKIFN